MCYERWFIRKSQTTVLTKQTKIIVKSMTKIADSYLLNLDKDIVDYVWCFHIAVYAFLFFLYYLMSFNAFLI